MNQKIKKISFVILLLAFLNMTFAPAAHADTWGANMMAAIWKQTTEQMVKSIQDTLLSNLKMAALRIIQARLFSLLGSNSNTTPGVAGYIISDWKAFIYSSATRYSDQVTTDFFRGLNIAATAAIRQNVIDPVENAIRTDYWSMRPDLQNYVAGGDAGKIFTPGATSNPWMAWQMAAAPQNDLAFTYLRAEAYKQAAYEQEKQAKQAEGVAGQGMKGKEATNSSSSSGSGQRGPMTPISQIRSQNITTPGSIIGNLMNEINNMPVRMLTLARSIPEVATAMVNQMISQVIQQGVTQIISPGSGGGSSNMSQQMKSQAQSLVQNGVRQALSPNMFFGR